MHFLPQDFLMFPALLSESDNCIPYFQEGMYIAENHNVIPQL